MELAMTARVVTYSAWRSRCKVCDEIGEAGKYVHLGLTSTDVKDTALG